MKHYESIRNAIFVAVDEINQMLPEDKQLSKSDDTIILDGNNGKLDSLELVNLVIATEEKINSEFGVELSLSEDMFILEDNPLKNIGSLTGYISSVLEEKGIG